MLTVKVEGTAIEPAMGFIDKESFPTFPDFLEDIPEVDDSGKRTSIAYDTTPGFTTSPPTYADP